MPLETAFTSHTPHVTAHNVPLPPPLTVRVPTTATVQLDLVTVGATSAPTAMIRAALKQVGLSVLPSHSLSLSALGLRPPLSRQQR